LSLELIVSESISCITVLVRRNTRNKHLIITNGLTSKLIEVNFLIKQFHSNYLFIDKFINFSIWFACCGRLFGPFIASRYFENYISVFLFSQKAVSCSLQVNFFIWVLDAILGSISICIIPIRFIKFISLKVFLRAL
jgi:hypothetical protein